MKLLNDHPRLIEAFQLWRTTTSEGMDKVFDLLEAGRYAEASKVLDTLSRSQAHVALQMRNRLIRSGHIKGEAVTDD